MKNEADSELSGRRDGSPKNWKFPSLAVFLALLAASLPGRPEQAVPPRTTRVYDLYVGFAAQKDCVPASGPYLTKLSHDLHVPGLRFVFEKRKLGETTVNWFPVLGKGPIPSIPGLVFDTAGHIAAELCPYIKCEKEIKKAWFTKQNAQFDAIFTVIPLEDQADILDELLNGDVNNNLETTVVDLTPCVLFVHFIAKDRYAWTGECIVRHQDCGGTADLEFYLALPAGKLLRGQEVSWEFPFQTDDIDAPGVLTVRFIPAGTIKS